jgi:phosphatidylethanolamine-binding protein (PEBP) family uncharacterized protein
MRRAQHAISVAALLAALALSGCGSVGTNGAPKAVNIPLTSSAIHGSQLSAAYTCDGRNISPPLTWGAVPSSVEELALFALEVGPSKAGRYTLTVDWAMAGVAPALHHLAAGELPRGAFVLEANDGKRRYSVCPARGTTARYEFALYALPSGVHAAPQLRSVSLLSNLSSSTPQTAAPADGAFLVRYTRR